MEKWTFYLQWIWNAEKWCQPVLSNARKMTSHPGFFRWSRSRRITERDGSLKLRTQIQSLSTSKHPNVRINVLHGR